jgi:hypothetical protein
MIRSNGYHRVVSVEAVGRGEIVKMQTSSSTFIADGFPHHNCGNRFSRRQLNYDHVVPRKQGGKTVWENIVSSCYPCNSRKAGRTPEQAGMRLLKRPYRPKELPLTAPAFPIAKAPEEWKFYLSEQVQAAFG